MTANCGQKAESLSRMLTVAEVAHLLHVHPNTVRKWSNIGLLKTCRIGPRYDRRFRAGDIDAFVAGEGEGTRGPKG